MRWSGPSILLTVSLLACSPPVGTSDSAAPSAAASDSGDPDDLSQPDPCDPDGDHVDPAMIGAASDWIGENAPHLDSFRVQHCGVTLVERYANGFDATTPHELQSATKTFSAVLIGIAMDQGLVAGLDQPIVELLPAYADLFQGEKANITVEHALTMTTGLAWTDFGAGNSFTRIAAADDSVAFILDEPLETSPGAVFHYNTGSSHLLSAIIHYNAGMTTAQYAEKHLFGPLGIASADWPALRDGVNQGGWGLYMTPPDFAKFGQMLLDDGVWEGVAVVDKSFVTAATGRQVTTDYGGYYGYQMWVETNLFNIEDVAAARGYGTQDCFVLDSLDMVVVFTGDIAHPDEVAGNVITVMNEMVIPSHGPASHTLAADVPER